MEEYWKKISNSKLTESSCEVSKELKCVSKRRTSGILVTVFPCGTIINFMELNKSEGKILVSSFLKATDQILNNEIKYLCYDDACHIAGLNKSTLNQKTFVIDRFHIYNHQNKCKTEYNCNNYPELDGINTEVCEQQFYLISRYKHQAKHMNKQRFNFFFIELFNLFNNNKLENNLNLLGDEVNNFFVETNLFSK